MLFQASSDVATVAYILGIGSPAFDTYGPGPLSIQNASLLMFAMARILFKNFATYSTVLDQFGAPPPLLGNSLTNPTQLLSYIHVLYTGTSLFIYPFLIKTTPRVPPRPMGHGQSRLHGRRSTEVIPILRLSPSCLH